MENGATTVENSMEVSEKIRRRTAVWPGNSPAASLKAGSQRDVATPRFTAAIFTTAKNGSNLSRPMNGLSKCGIFINEFCLKQKENSAICYDRGELWRHYAKCNKPVTKDSTVWLHLHEALSIAPNHKDRRYRGDWQGLGGEGRIGTFYLTGTELQTYKMTRVMTMDGCYGWTTMCTNLTSLKCMPKSS